MRHSPHYRGLIDKEFDKNAPKIIVHTDRAGDYWVEVDETCTEEPMKGEGEHGSA